MAALSQAQTEILAFAGSACSASGETAWSIPAPLPQVTKAVKVTRKSPSGRSADGREKARGVLLKQLQAMSSGAAITFVTELEELLDEQSAMDQRYFERIRKIGFELASKSSNLKTLKIDGAVTPKDLLVRVAGLQ